MSAMGRGSGKTPDRVMELIAKEVEKKGQNQAAKDIKIPLYSLQKYLTGKTEPTQASLKKLADYFGVSVWYLLGSSAKQMYEAAGKPSEDDPYWKEMWEKLPSETVLELESCINKYPELWNQFLAIPRENKSEAFNMLKIYMEGLSITALRLFRERNKLDPGLEWHDQEQ